MKKHYTILTKSETNMAAESLAELIVQRLRSENEPHKGEIIKLVKPIETEKERPDDESSKPL